MVEIFLCHKYKVLTHVLGNTIIEDKNMIPDDTLLIYDYVYESPIGVPDCED